MRRTRFCGIGEVVRWSSTIGAVGLVLLLLGTLRGRVTWNYEPSDCTIVVRGGVVVAIWVSTAAIEKEVARVRGLPALPQGGAGQGVLDGYRRGLWLRSREGLEVEVSQVQAEKALAGKPLWSWLGGNYPVARREVSGFAFALWPAVALCVIVSATTWTFRVREHLRAGTGWCSKCGYDRHGLAADAKCPECGTVPAPASK